MPQSVRPSDAQIINAYEAHGTCRAAGLFLGIAPQTVHKRLHACGHGAKPRPVYTAVEDARIISYYRNTPHDDFDPTSLSAELGRSGNSIYLRASRLGLGKFGRNLKPSSRQKIGEKASERHRTRGHPKGMLGKKHTDEVKAAIAQNSAQRWATDKAFGIGQMSPEARDRRSLASSIRVNNRISAQQHIHSRAKGGKADDLGDTWFRSSWERNYARYLNLLIKMKIVDHWDYEKECFWFDGIRRGCVSYRPDFRVKYRNVERLEYVEIKGWVTAKDKTKWKRMKKYHPLINLVVVAAKEYREIANRWSSSIPQWEKAERKPAFIKAFGREVPIP